MKIKSQPNIKIYSLIKKYLVHLQFERRLSLNTVNAYSFDLVKYANYLTSTYNLSSPKQVKLIYIKEFLKT